MNEGTATKEATMKTKADDRLIAGWLREMERRVIRKQAKPETYWSETLKRTVTVPVERV